MKVIGVNFFLKHSVYADMRGGSIGGGGVKYNKCKRLVVLQRGVFILGMHRCRLLTTQVFAALGVRDTDDCHDISRYQILQ